MRQSFLFGAIFLTGCQILSGLSDYEASEEDPPQVTAGPFGKRFGGSGIDGVAGAAIATDGSIVIGGTMANVDFGSGQPLITYGLYDPFLAKFDGLGNHLASVSFGTPDGDLMLDMAMGPDGRIAVVGLFRSTLSFGGGIEIEGTTEPSTEEELRLSVFVASFDASLNTEWAVALSTFESLVSVHVDFDPAGNLVVAGTHDGTVDFMGEPITSDSDQDVFVLGLSAEGEKRWLKHYPAVNTVALPEGALPSVADVAIDGSGNAHVLISQYWGIAFDTATGTADPAGDIALVKLEPSGNESWVRFYGGPSLQVPTALAIDLADRPLIAGVFLTGYTAGDATFPSSGPLHADVFVSRFNTSGEHLTTTIFGGVPITAEGDASFVTSLEAASDGSFLATGALYDQLTIGDTTLQNTSSVTPNLDVLLVRLDAALAPSLAKRYGDANPDSGIWAGLHPSGNLVATGTFREQLRFADYDFTSAGETDIFLVHYDP